jgi:hypothetical protein
MGSERSGQSYQRPVSLSLCSSFCPAGTALLVGNDLAAALIAPDGKPLWHTVFSSPQSVQGWDGWLLACPGPGETYCARGKCGCRVLAVDGKLLHSTAADSGLDRLYDLTLLDNQHVVGVGNRLDNDRLRYFAVAWDPASGRGESTGSVGQSAPGITCTARVS